MAEKSTDKSRTPENSGGNCSEQLKDDELSQLLDSSLNDFGKSTINPLLHGSEAAENKFENAVGFDAETTKRAACDFQKMLDQLVGIQKVMMQQAETGDAPESSINGSLATSFSKMNGHGSQQTDEKHAASPPANLREAFRGIENIVASGHKENHFEEEPDDLLGDDNDDDLDNMAGMAEQDELKMAHAFLENMQILAEKAQKVQKATTEEEIANAMKELSDDDTYETEFMPFMHGLMGSLLSKDILYPPLKDMCEKYPQWLSINKEKLDEKTYSNYEQQLQLMTQVCQEFDNEKPEDTDLDRAQRMDRLITMMQKIQSCGYPPEDLVGNLPEGWAYDSQTGLPKAEDMEKAAEACTLM